MTTMTNKGLILGKFTHMHKGHLFAILEAAQRCHTLTVLLCIDYEHDPDGLTPHQRLFILNKELGKFKNITVETIDCTAFPYDKEDNDDVSKYWANALFERYPDLGTLFGSEKYVEMMANHWPDCNGIKYEILDLSRKTFPTSATAIRTETVHNFGYLVESAKPFFTKHVLVIGSESCGKSTLVKNLGSLLKAPVVPEMYRSMFPDKGMDFKSSDLIAVAKAQNNAVDCQVHSPLNSGIVIRDTCNDVTLAYSELYYPEDVETHEAIKLEKSTCEYPIHLVLFCDIDVPWEQDGTRDQGNLVNRKQMRDKFYSLAVKKAKDNNCPMVVLGADYKRIPDAMKAIEDNLL